MFTILENNKALECIPVHGEYLDEDENRVEPVGHNPFAL